MGDSRSFGAQSPELAHLVRGSGGLSGEVNDLRGDVDEGFQAMEAEVSGAAVAAAHLQLDVQATEGDTVTIGGDVYEFVDTIGAGVAGGIEVLVGGSAAQQLLNIIAAMNRTSTIGTESSGHGEENVRGSAYNTDFLRVEWSNKPGGDPLPGPKPNVALAESLTDTATWDHENLNRTGGNVSTKKVVHEIDVDAVNLATDFDVVAPGELVSSQVLYVTDAAGDVDVTGKAASIVLTNVPARNAVTVGLDDGATDPVVTDKVFLEITYR